MVPKRNLEEITRPKDAPNFKFGKLWLQSSTFLTLFCHFWAKKNYVWMKREPIEILGSSQIIIIKTIALVTVGALVSKQAWKWAKCFCEYACLWKTTECMNAAFKSSKLQFWQFFGLKIAKFLPLFSCLSISKWSYITIDGLKWLYINENCHLYVLEVPYDKIKGT